MDASNDDPNDYEAIRRKRMMDNERMMLELGLGDGGTSAGFTRRSIMSKSKVSRDGESHDDEDEGEDKGSNKRRKKNHNGNNSNSNDSNVPLRRSSRRLQGDTANLVYLSGAKNATQVAVSEATGEVIGLDGLPDESKQHLKEKVEVADSFAITPTGEALFESLKNLEVVEGFKIKSGKDYVSHITKLHIPNHDYIQNVANREKVYSVAFHPSTSNILLASGDTNGNLSLWNVKESKGRVVKESSIISSRPHSSVINHVQFSGTKLFTFAYDSVVKVVDLAHFQSSTSTKGESTNNAKFEIVFNHPGSNEDSRLQHGIFHEPSNVFYVGLTDGTVYSQDFRTNKPIINYVPVHEKKVQTVSVHDNYLLTASLDRSSKIFDIRKLHSSKAKVGTETYAEHVCILPDERSVNCAYFSPDGKYIATCSQADTIRLYSSAQNKSGDDIEADHIISHDNKTGRFLCVFHLQWDPKSEGAFAIGSKRQPRELEIYGVASSNNSSKLTKFVSLRSDHLGSICSRVAFHPHLNMLAGVNSSGLAHIFVE